jgi:glutamate decarboxylase
MNEAGGTRRGGLVATPETLRRVFVMRENDSARETLVKYMEQILFGLQDFLRRHVGITEEVPIKELSSRYMDSTISLEPEKRLAEVITGLIKEIAPHAVNVSSPYFVGHMTGAMPFFMVHLQTIVAALNQNVVKVETSKVVSIVEKETLAKIHRLIFKLDDGFYNAHIQSPSTSLGGFVEDGTLANLTALWVARDRLLAPRDGFEGVEREGVPAAYKEYGIDRLVVIVSQLGHYSLRKSGGVLGIGNQNVLPVPVDRHNKIDVNRLRALLDDLRANEPKTRVLALVGIAGATETGTVDPLERLADIAQERGIHFHVDAAWGGPTLFSEKYRHVLSGIERADSVTIDGHKQFYMPMTCGMVYFKDPNAMDAIAYHSNYVARPGSVDLGIRSLAGSRPSTALILHGALKVMGQRGYALLIDHGIDLAREFALEIQRRPNFQLLTPPELNILTYRYCPANVQEWLDAANCEERRRITIRLNRGNMLLQRRQREHGKSFVSRTTLRRPEQRGGDMVVLRSVLMNPMTTIGILKEILDEQEAMARGELAKAFTV